MTDPHDVREAAQMSDDEDPLGYDTQDDASGLAVRAGLRLVR
jgi:hypothetical protein